MPYDVLKVGDHFTVTDQNSKHYKKTGVVKKINRLKYTVKFDNKQTGKYVDKTSVMKLWPDTEVEDLGTALKNLAITGGTLIARMPLKEGQTEKEKNAQILSSFQKSMKEAIDSYSNAFDNDN